MVSSLKIAKKQALSVVAFRLLSRLQTWQWVSTLGVFLSSKFPSRHLLQWDCSSQVAPDVLLSALEHQALPWRYFVDETEAKTGKAVMCARWRLLPRRCHCWGHLAPSGPQGVSHSAIGFSSYNHRSGLLRGASWPVVPRPLIHRTMFGSRPSLQIGGA